MLRLHSGSGPIPIPKEQRPISIESTNSGDLTRNRRKTRVFLRFRVCVSVSPHSRLALRGGRFVRVVKFRRRRVAAMLFEEVASAFDVIGQDRSDFAIHVRPNELSVPAAIAYGKSKTRRKFWFLGKKIERALFGNICRNSNSVVSHVQKKLGTTTIVRSKQRSCWSRTDAAPRQARYQEALRPDKKFNLPSRVVSSSPLVGKHFFPDQILSMAPLFG